MNTDDDINSITEKVIGCAYTVANTMGVGFLEKVYENALVHELRRSGLQAIQQTPIPVWYDEIQVGDFVADILVNERVLIELKAVRALESVHEAQCLNYLRATGMKLCLLINFGRPKVQIQRIVL